MPPRKKAAPAQQAQQQVQPLDVHPHEGHELADTYHFSCAACLAQVRRLKPGDPMIQVWASPTVNEKTGAISKPGTVVPRAKVAELVESNQPLSSLLG